MSEYQAEDRVVRGLYASPQPAGLCAVREYLLTDREGVRVLLLRWVKETEYPIDEMTFDVTMLDALGEELGTMTVTRRGSDIPAAETGHVFTPERGIVVDGGCTDVRVRLTEVRSGCYIYRVENGAVTTDYEAPEPWRYDPRGGEREGLTDTACLRVRSKRAGKVRFLWPAALLTVILLVYALLRPYLPYLI